MKAGDKIVCIDNSESKLELYKIYTIMKSNIPQEFIDILDPDNWALKETGSFSNKRRFISLQEYRKQKLKKIL